MVRCLFLISLALIFIHENSVAQRPPKKIALIIGISKYKEFKGVTNWRAINGVNDIKFIRAALVSQGFNTTDIDTLKNEQATKAGMVQALEKLRDRAGEGDIVVFHFSGHGQQIYDNYRKDEWDGYDESLVPFDAKMVRDQISDTGQFHFRDDELGDKLKEIRTRIGPSGSLLVLLDACYSGTATRGDNVAISRGTHIRFEPKDYEKTIDKKSVTPNQYEALDDKDLLANMVVISPVSPNEENYEVKDPEMNNVGPLSYAFSRAVSQISGEINYQILFEKIRTDIHFWRATQNPMIEGDLSQKVLGGKYIPVGEIVRVNWTSDKTIELPRGILHNVFEGAHFKIFPIDEMNTETSTPIAVGVISGVTVTSSTGTLESEVKNRDNKLYKAVIDARTFGEIGLTVKVLIPDPAIANHLRSKLRTSDFITLDKPNADLAVGVFKNSKTQKQQLQLITAEDIVLWEKDWPANRKALLTASELDTIQAGIKKHAVAQFLRKVEIPDNDPELSNVIVKVIPVKLIRANPPPCTFAISATLELNQKKNKKGELEFLELDEKISENEGFVISVKNSSNRDVYLSVLDITPKDGVSVLIPDPEDPRETPYNYRISPDKKLEPCPIFLSGPYGREHFKILISTQPLDLKGIQQQSLKRKLSTSFEQFYNQALNRDPSATKRWKTPVVKNGEIKIYPFVFNILERK